MMRNGSTESAAVAEIEHPMILDQSMAVSLTRAEIDQQIATAKAYPRSIEKASKNIMTLATLDEESAEECVYALPRGGKPIKGPSARLAEIIFSQWGNARAGARIIHVDKHAGFVEAEGVFHDLETNAASSQKVRRSIKDKYGKVYKDDMIIVTGNAACSIAKRNAILTGVPKAVWRKAYEQVERVLAGSAETLTVTRDKMMKAFAAFGVKPERVCAALSLTGPADIKLEHIPVLRGMYATLKNGEATVEEMFAEEKGAAPPSAPGKAPPSAPKAGPPPAPKAAPTDADKQSPPAAPKGPPPAPKVPEATPELPLADDKISDGAAFLTKLREEIESCGDQETLDDVWGAYTEIVERLPDADEKKAKELYAAAEKRVAA